MGEKRGVKEYENSTVVIDQDTIELAQIATIKSCNGRCANHLYMHYSHLKELISTELQFEAKYVLM